MSQHISVAEYRQLTAPGKSKVVKSGKVSHNTCPTEYQEAVVLKNRLDDLVTAGKVLHYAHLINELSLNRRAGQKPNFAYLNKLKAEGWKVGVPDYLVILKDKVVFIELKRIKGGTVSPEQKQWIEAINQAGGHAAVCKGATEAIKYVEGLL
jgi:hypothetical protein